MTTTYTIRHETLGAAELERLTEWTHELPVAAKAVAMLVGAPLLGLAFVITLPIAGVVLAAWMAVRRCAGAVPVVKRVALFAAAPFVGLAYLVAFPLVGIGALVFYGIRAARK